jgi:hypothetical protein
MLLYSQDITRCPDLPVFLSFRLLGRHLPSTPEA